MADSMHIHEPGSRKAIVPDLVYSARSMKAMNWLQDRFRNYWHFLSPLLGGGGLLLLYLSSQKQVELLINGQSYMLSTHARTVGSLLADLELTPQDGDEIVPALDRKLANKQVIEYKQSVPVVLDVNGELWLSRTTHSISENILAQAGFRLFPGDTLDRYPTVNAPLNPSGRDHALWLHIDRGYPIRLQVEGETRHFSSSAPTLGEALWEQGLYLFEGDQLIPEPGIALDQEIQATLQRSKDYVIELDGQVFVRRGAGESVGEVLAQAGVDLVGLDYSVPDVLDNPPADGVIRVVRVVEELFVELEPVEFETVYRPADQLELDTLEVMEPGTFGVRSKTIRVRFEDGEEVSRNTEDAVLAVEPKDRVIGYGTRIVVRTLDTGQGQIEYWRAIPIYATSYSPCRLGVPWCGTATASGKAVDRGVIGVIRSWYNLMRGWSVYVPGYGPGTFEDIGAGIAGRDWIDLGFTDDNFEPWHQWTTLYFLTPVPPLDSIPWILP